MVTATDSHGKMQSPNESRHRLSKADAEQLLSDCQDDQFSACLRGVLRGYPATGWLTINQTAELSGVSVRSLQRRLAAMGVSFAQISNECRLEIAKELLADTDQSLSEIAMHIGYSESQNFIRAFKRGTGQTPEEFRQRNRQ